MPIPEVAFPCGSASTSSTRCPQFAIIAARLTAVVVLPTPPFWFATAIDFIFARKLTYYPHDEPQTQCFTCPISEFAGLFCELDALLLGGQVDEEGRKRAGR